MANPFRAVGALFALALLFSSPFLVVVEATPTVMGAITPPGIPTTVGAGQPYSIDLRDYLGSEFDPWFNKESNKYVLKTEAPSWLSVGLVGHDSVTTQIEGGQLILSGTPSDPGSYNVLLQFMNGVVGQGGTLFEGIQWTINVVPPTPYTVTLISDPTPVSIETSAGTVALTNGAATIYSGTIMQAPDLQRERQILHRWTDAAGNTYDWSKPVTSDLTLTADWREHYTVSVVDNRATVTISPDLPTEYTLYEVDWGDNAVDNRFAHLYALPGDYTITVRSGAWQTWVSSSTAVTVETVTELPIYTVMFSGAGVTASPQTVQYGNLATEPQAPVRDGYTFTGWYMDGVVYDFAAPVTGNLYLSAGWTPVTPGDDDETSHSTLLIALAIISLVSLAVTLLTRSPYALAVTVILALVELALLALGIYGVIV